ncbi:MAG: N-acetylmuramoyl-L-alanine amidase [Chthoniobacterales bacterium]
MNEHSVSRRSRAGVRFASWFLGALLLSSVLASLLHAQISEEDRKKRDAFLKAREEMHTIASPTPSKSDSPAAKPKPAKKKSKKGKTTATDDDAEPAKTPAKKKRADADDEDHDTPKPTKRTTPAKPRSDEDEEEAKPTPRPRETVYPAARPDGSTPPPRPPVVVTPPVPTVQQPPPDITIQKSGFEQEQGFEPPPPPPPRRSFWARLFGGGGGERNFRYLDRNVVAAIRSAPVQRSRWKFIIVHNSGTKQGNARAFDYYHRNVRHMQNGMAYHFVVGNGTSSGNGQVEVGDRWRRQINGGHVHSDYLNNISLGICLVGDFNRGQPTRAQLDATEELIKYLRDRCGRVEGHAIGVRPHREMNPPRWATDCPGDAFPYDWFRRF